MQVTYTPRYEFRDNSSSAAHKRYPLHIATVLFIPVIAPPYKYKVIITNEHGEMMFQDWSTAANAKTAKFFYDKHMG